MQLKSAINLREKQKVELKNKLLLEKLERSNDELQEYAHIVSHDLKSPLRSLNALITWIKEDNEGKLDTTSLDNIQLIESTLEKMEILISDILSYSSIDSDKSENRKVDINLVIDDIKEILFIPENISIVVNNQLPIVFGERAKLQQLFQNLISNAIKFNDKEKGVITIDVKDKKSFYQFSISDNGLGIEKKYHDKIFKIFHSLNKSKNSSGIGLSIVKKIVDLYQGEIWLESELNEGATFHFTLKKQHGTT
jgi:light-regulated signal transduction histidine kinase (bacteriophytochrome)